MLAFARAGFVAALVTLLSVPLSAPAAAQKAFVRDDLADAAIKLEAQIKAEAGQLTKSAATLRREADAAFQRNDFRTALQVMGQIATVAPNDSTNWLRLARTVLQVRPGNDRERTTLLERSATAAYIAYQRTKLPAEEADSLLIISRTYADRSLWRPALDAMRLSLDLREVADVRQQYERMREDHGFRLLDYTVDSDSASPRVCFQFSEELPGRRADLSPFVVIAGVDKPALSVEEKQLCVEGLKHGEHYNITLRAGIPSVVHETLAKSADFNVYVRDRKPSVRFSSKAYVLPRTGQHGIPVISVNTKAVTIEIYRIGDRNLLNTVVGSDFQRTLDRYDMRRLTEERGSQVWKGEMKVEQSSMPTSPPLSRWARRSGPAGRRLCDGGGSSGRRRARSYQNLATQWFIVSDLGLTAFSGNDGVHVFVNSLEIDAAEGGRRNPAAVAQQRGAGDQAHRRRRPRAVRSRADARGGRARAGAPDRDRSEGRLRLPQPQGAGLRPQRSRRRRPRGAGRARCVRLYRARRLPLRRNRAGHGAAARRAGRRRARRAAHDGGRAARRRRISPHGRGRPGRRRPRARGSAGRLGADRHLARARLYRSEASAGRRDHLHGRGLRAGSARVRSCHGGQEHLQGGAGGSHASTAAISMARRPPTSISKARW